MIESIFLWPYLPIVCFIIGLGSTHYAYYGRIKRIRKEYEAELGSLQRDRYRLFDLTHNLLRAFRIRPIDNPYVVEKMENGEVNDHHVFCFHCRKSRFEGHSNTCAWAYTNKIVSYAPDGSMHLKPEVTHVNVGLRDTP